MTRVLVWNIQKLSTKKLRSTETRLGKWCEPHTSITRSRAADDRLSYILDHFSLGAPAVSPDIVFIVELMSRNRVRGRLAKESRPRASTRLVRDVRTVTGNAAWMMVPPVMTNGRESVGVLYDSSVLAFTGPWRWPGGNGPAFDPAAPGALTPQSYPNRYRRYLPSRKIPVGARNAGRREARCAPGGTLTWKAGSAVAGVYDPGTLRLPYWVTFSELNNATVPPTAGRQLTFFAFHSPASYQAGAYLTLANDFAEVIDNQAGNEIRVLLGDFNLNLMTYAATMPLATPYQALVTSGYALALSRPGNPPAPMAGYANYFATLLRPWLYALYATAKGGHPSYYPGNQFLDRRQDDTPVKRTFWAIDNMLVRYGPGQAGAIQNATILNGVVGSPYNVVNPPPGGAPAGHYPFDIAMQGLAYQHPGATSPPWSSGCEKNFRTWYNYGCIRSTSDHCALVADI